MRNQRGKQFDWSKPFRLILFKKQFDSIEATDTDASGAAVPEQIKKQVHQDKKQEIIVPKIQIVKRVTQIKPFAKIPLGYIRLRKDLNLPKLYFYELTEVDHIFVNAHEGKFKINGKSALTTLFLQKSFVEMETKAGRDPTLPRSKAWMLNFIERQYKQLTKMEKYEEFAEVIYNYWRNRREQLKFPLLRPLWRPNQDQYNHLLAFKVRQKEKRNLRRANRVTDQEIGLHLCDQFDTAIRLVQRVKTRQELRLKLVKLQILNFHGQCKQFKSKTSIGFLDQWRRENWSEMMQKDKQQIKRFQSQVQMLKMQKDEQEEQDAKDDYFDGMMDLKLSTANFIATVVSQAQSKGISYQTMFQTPHNLFREDLNSNVPLVQTNCSRSNKNSGFQISIKPEVEKEESTQIDRSQILQVDLSIYGDIINRSFSTDYDSPKERFASPHNFLDFKRNEICSAYFGDDDDGDFKDLKKNISSAFKRFQQLTRQE